MKTVHLMGIGGTGMVALAGLFKEKGWSVQGSDKDVYPPASDELARLQVKVLNGFKAENLASKPDLVVVGNVISKNNVEAEALLASGLKFVSMPEALREHFLKERRSLVVTGTHGKSTTSALLSWILDFAGFSPGFFIGGFPNNFTSGCRLGSGKPFVIEGDEYDTAFFEKTPKFLHYRPDDIIVTSIEFDHADIYRDLNHIVEQFEKLITILPPDGNIVACGDHETVRQVCSKSERVLLWYGLSQQNSFWADAILPTERGLSFELKKGKDRIVRVDSPLLGTHNVLNAVACMLLAELNGVPFEKSAEAISTFKGIRRRQEHVATVREIRIYDDFAHHPTAIEETLKAFRTLVRQGQKLWAVFEPRSNTSRRRIFQESLPASLMFADEIILAPVFQKADALANQDMLSPEEVAESVRKKGKPAIAAKSYEEILERLQRGCKSGDLVLFMSNGAFGGLPKKLASHL